jgi:hypothetical protein
MVGVEDLASRVPAMASAWLGDRGDDPRTVAESLRVEDLGSYLIFLSAQPEKSLPPRFGAEIAAARERCELNRRLGSDLARAHPDAWIVKGTAIADLYGPVLRFSWDIDVVCASADRLWELGSWLIDEQGFERSALTLFSDPRRGLEDYLVAFTAPDTEVWEWPAQIDICTLFFVGDGRAPAPVPMTEVTQLSAWARHLLSVCIERFERTFVFKDAVDAGLIIERLTEAEIDQVHSCVRRFGWEPEFDELLGAAERIGFDVRHRFARSPATALRLRTEPVRRMARSGARHVGSVGRSVPQAVQHRALVGGGAVAARAWRRLARLPTFAAPPATAWFYGMPVLAGPGSSADVRGEDRRLLHTAVGLWFLTASDEVDSEELTHLGVTPRRPA